MGKKVRVDVEKNLIPKDLKRYNEIKRLARMSTDLGEIIDYTAEMKYLVKKAYVRQQLKENC